MKAADIRARLQATIALLPAPETGMGSREAHLRNELRKALFGLVGTARGALDAPVGALGQHFEKVSAALLEATWLAGMVEEAMETITAKPKTAAPKGAKSRKRAPSFHRGTT